MLSLMSVIVCLCCVCAACPECGVSDREQAARLKLAAIKQQILSKLQLSAAPNITAPLPRKVALEAIRQAQPTTTHTHTHHTGDEDGLAARDDYYARTSEIIAFAEPGRSLNGHVLLDFYPSHEHFNSKLRVTSAKLWIQLRPLPPSAPSTKKGGRGGEPRRQNLTLYVFRVQGNSTDQMHHLASLRQGAEQGWKGLEVSGAVQAWFQGGDEQQREKMTLLVDCVGCDSSRLEMVLFHDEDNGNNNISGGTQSSSRSNNSTTNNSVVTATVTARKIRHGGHSEQLLGLRPFLAVATETTEPRRSRRHSRTCGGRPVQCCRQNLYVSFEELGWGDWIIAPKGYYANFCMGHCNGPRTPDTFPTFHTHVIEEYRSRNPYASIHPCCAPTRLSPMSLIYFDPDLNIIKTDLPKMIVEDCGCT